MTWEKGWLVQYASPVRAPFAVTGVFGYVLTATQIIENPVLNGETIRLDGALRMAPR
ncbi:MAG: hypothetical protein R3E02_16490 [Blastomonas sp.]